MDNACICINCIFAYFSRRTLNIMWVPPRKGGMYEYVYFRGVFNMSKSPTEGEPFQPYAFILFL